MKRRPGDTLWNRVWEAEIKAIGFVAILVGALTMAAFVLLSIVAFSDAHARCPGNQCRDAIRSGIIFTILSLAGVAVTVIGFWCLRQVKRSYA